MNTTLGEASLIIAHSENDPLFTLCVPERADAPDSFGCELYIKRVWMSNHAVIVACCTGGTFTRSYVEDNWWPLTSAGQTYDESEWNGILEILNDYIRYSLFEELEGPVDLEETLKILKAKDGVGRTPAPELIRRHKEIFCKYPVELYFEDE